MIIKETNAEYDARRRSEWVSPSDIKGLRVPMDFLVKRSKPIEQKDIFDIGTAFHTAVLEPEEFAKNITYFPEADFPDKKNPNKDGSASMQPKANKEALIEFQNENKGRVILRESNWDMIAAMVLSFEAHWGAKKMLDLKNGKSEYSYYARYIWNKKGDFERIEAVDSDTKTDSKLIMLVRTKADFVHDNRDFAMDLKSTINVAPKVFAKQAANLEYDIQAAMVLNLVSANMKDPYETFIFCAIEKTWPYYVAMYDTDYSDILQAQHIYIKRLNEIRKAKASGKFKGFEYLADNDFGLLPLDLPGWYRTQQATSKF